MNDRWFNLYADGSTGIGHFTRASAAKAARLCVAGVRIVARVRVRMKVPA
jgi:hypothetical protein